MGQIAIRIRRLNWYSEQTAKVVGSLSKVMTPGAVKMRAGASSLESILYVWNNTNAMEISLPGFP